MTKLLSAAFLSLIAAFNYATEQEKQFTGLAYHLETGELIYLEQHIIRYVDGLPYEETINYLRPNGDLLGTKQMNYVEPVAPNYELMFQHIERLEQVTRTDSEIVINARNQSIVPIPNDNFAIDGGFHYFILQNFEALLAGDRIPFDFLSASRGDFVPLRLEPTFNDGKTLKVEIQFDHFLLSRFIDPILLSYNIEERRMLSYEGLTNVPKSVDELYIARIEYQYDTDVQSFLDLQD